MQQTTDFVERARAVLRYDLPASLVVFLVALPLSLGIAVASGAPVLAGIIAAIVGGIIAGALGGSPLQVSGPAAGLAAAAGGGVCARARSALAGALDRSVDLAAALGRVEGDRELLEELVPLFADECPKNMAEMRRALEGRDAHGLERLADTMKGASASLGAKRVSETALELEKQACSGAFDHVGELIENLQREVDRLLPGIESFCRRVTP